MLVTLKIHTAAWFLAIFLLTQSKTGLFAYRFNRRFEPGSMIERLAYVDCRTAPLPYRFAKMAELHT